MGTGICFPHFGLRIVFAQPYWSGSGGLVETVLPLGSAGLPRLCPSIVGSGPTGYTGRGVGGWLFMATVFTAFLSAILVRDLGKIW